jgi:hypothetical protein
VTALAVCTPVLAAQRVAGITVVVEARRSPVLRGVTGFAVLTEAPFVLVVVAVAGKTRRRRRLGVRLSVARLALGARVLADQWESRA